MSRDDRQRWDAKWADIDETPQPNKWLQRHDHILHGGVALDIACGRGQNSLWLAARGYETLGVDISIQALSAARAQGVARGLAPRLLFVLADLDRWRPAPASCNLVVVFRFLERALFPALTRALRPGGLLIYETYHEGRLQQRRDASRAYLLQRKELPRLVSPLDVLAYRETDQRAQLVAQKPR